MSQFNINTKTFVLNSICREAWVDEEVILASGDKSSYYINCKRISMTTMVALRIGDVFRGALAKFYPRYIGGPESGAIPLVTSTIISFGVNGIRNVDGFYVRKATKDHGLQNMIEGQVEPGTDVVILEDVMTSGGSAIKAAEVAFAAGLNVVAIACLVDRQAGATEAIAELSKKQDKQIEYIPIFTLDEVVKARDELINRDQQVTDGSNATS